MLITTQGHAQSALSDLPIGRTRKVTKAQKFLTVAQLRRIAQEFNREFWGGSLEIPEIKIQNNLRADWLGCTATGIQEKDGRYTITKFYMAFQKSILADERTAKRVVAHELIHVWQHQQMTPEELYNDSRFNKQLGPAGAQRRAHGPDFQRWASKINSKYGDDFVTTTSNSEYKQSVTKEFYLVVVPYNGKFAFNTMQRPTPTALREIDMVNARRTQRGDDPWKIFKSTDPALKDPSDFFEGAPYRKGGRNISLPGTPEAAANLKNLYEKGTPLALEVKTKPGKFNVGDRVQYKNRTSMLGTVRGFDPVSRKYQVEFDMGTFTVKERDLNPAAGV